MSADDPRPVGGRRPRPAKPTPVRALDDSSSKRAQAPAPPPEAVHFRLAERGWVAEAMGQAEGAGGAGMLLVRFTSEGPGDGLPEQASGPAGQEAEASLEAWVVGVCLTDVPEARLIEALGRAEPWKGSATDAPFFVEEGGRRGR